MLRYSPFQPTTTLLFNHPRQAALGFGMLAILVAHGLSPVAAQDATDTGPTGPKLLTIMREHVKVGRNNEHRKFETGFPAAFEKANSPDYYLAMTSLTGPNEAWYLVGNQSFRDIEDSMKRDDKDPVLSAELNRLALADSAYINSVDQLLAVAQPRLSLGDFPDLSKVRHVEVTIFRVHPGREMDFEEVAKAYASALKRVAPNASYRAYAVLAGMEQPTYLFFSAAEKYDELDQRLAAGESLFKQASDEEKAAFKKFGDVAARVETQHFRIDPLQSYVPKEWREQDPDFWSQK